MSEIPTANGQKGVPGDPGNMPMEGIEHPHPHDVLCGRGGGTNNHIGNNHWRTLVAANKRLYLSLPKRQKMLVAQSIVRAVRSQDPPGRFLQKDKTKKWCDIGDQKAQDKTSQALREGAPEIRTEMKNEEVQRREIAKMAATAGLISPSMGPMMQSQMQMAMGPPGQQQQYPVMAMAPGSMPPPQQAQVPFPPGWNQQQQQQQQARGYATAGAAAVTAWQAPPQKQQEKLRGSGMDPSAAIRPTAVLSSSQAQQQPQCRSPLGAESPALQAAFKPARESPDPSAPQAKGQGHEQHKRKHSSSGTDTPASAAGLSQPTVPTAVTPVQSPQPFVAHVAGGEQTDGEATGSSNGGSSSLMPPPPVRAPLDKSAGNNPEALLQGDLLPSPEKKRGLGPAPTPPLPHGYGNIMDQISQLQDHHEQLQHQHEQNQEQVAAEQVAAEQEAVEQVSQEQGLEPPRLMARHSSMGRRVLPPNARLRFQDNGGGGGAKVGDDPSDSIYPGRNFPQEGGPEQLPISLLDDDEDNVVAGNFHLPVGVAAPSLRPNADCKDTQAGAWNNVRDLIDHASKKSSDAEPVSNDPAAGTSRAEDVAAALQPDFPRESSGDPSLTSFARDISMMSNISAFSTGGLSDMFDETAAGAAPTRVAMAQRTSSGDPAPLIRGISGVSVGNVDMGDFERGISAALSEMSLSRGPSLTTAEFGGISGGLLKPSVSMAMGDLLTNDDAGDDLFNRASATSGEPPSRPSPVTAGGMMGPGFSGSGLAAGGEGSYGVPGGPSQPSQFASRQQVGQADDSNADAPPDGLDEREQLEVTFLNRGQSLAFQNFSVDEA